jgi:Flp pilus assembly protein TadD
MKKMMVPSLLISLAIWSSGCAHNRYPSSSDELKFALYAVDKGMWREAKFRFENLVKANPNNALAHNNLAVALEALGLFQEAEAEYVRAINLDQNNDYIKENFRNVKKILKEKVVQN